MIHLNGALLRQVSTALPRTPVLRGESTVRPLMRALTLAFVLSLFLFRPAALGQNFVPVGLITVAVLFGVYTLGCIPKGQKALVRDLLILGLLVCVYLTYEAGIAILFSYSNLDFVLKQIVTVLVILVCYATFLADRRNNELFFRHFTNVVSLLGWSSAITVAAALFVHLDHLTLFHFSMKGYEGRGVLVETGTVYFPLSMGYGTYAGSGITLMRLTGFFREPGIYQAIAAFCLVVASVTSRSWFIRLGLVVGIIFTFSTAGIAMLVFAIGATYFLKSRLAFVKILVLGTVLLTCVYATLYVPVVGLLDKKETHGTSITERTTAILEGMRRVADNPLGTGLYSAEPTSKRTDIGLLAAIGSLGVIGFLLQVILLSGVRGSMDASTRQRLIACTPVLLTALFSQPIAGEAMLYVLVMWSAPKRVASEQPAEISRSV